MFSLAHYSYQKQIENCYFERNDPSKMSEIILQTRSCDPRKISLESTLNLGGKTETWDYRIISIRISNVYRAKIPSLECFKWKVTKSPQRSELHVKLEKFLGLYYYLLSPLSYQICVDYLQYFLSFAGPPPVHQLIRNDKTEKPPTVSVSSAPTFSPVLRPEDGHRGMDSPHSQTGMCR